MRALGVLLAIGLAACGSPPERPKAPSSARAAPVAKPADERPAFLNHDQLKGGIDQAEEAVRGCYTLTYSGKEDAQGTLTVDFTVAPSGKVSKVALESTLEDVSFQDCVRKVYEGLSFPQATHSTDASYPYRFGGFGG